MLVVLCGGSGTRMSQDSLPKPLTLMMAQPVLAHALRAVAPLVPAILFVYSRHLAVFNFEQVVVNLFKTTRCHFVIVDFHTRGAVETALVGMLAFEGCGEEEPLVFVDNDNVYPASLADILKSGGAPVAGSRSQTGA